MTVQVMVQPRIENPGVLIPEALPPIMELLKAVRSGGVAGATLELVHLRASQVNGCSYCVEAGAGSARKAGMSVEKVLAVSAWRESPHFDRAERAALALAEYATRIADTSDAVPDAVWDEAAAHYDERQLAALTLMIGVTNLFNRINVTTRQPAGAKR